MRYEVIGRDASLGEYEAETPEDAIEACVVRAGYASVEDMEACLGVPCDLRAVSLPSGGAR